MNTQPELVSESREQKPRLSTKLLIPLLMLLFALVAAVGILAGIRLASRSNTTAAGGVGLTIDKNAGVYVAPEAEEAPQGVAVPGWGSITIPAGQTEVAVDFYNPEANADQYYLTFELRLTDDSEQGYETLYTSGLVEPGLHIQKITLSHALSAGEYDAVVHVQPYRMDEAQTATNNADMKTTLIVQ
jgi:hypothetical protein